MTQRFQKECEGCCLYEQAIECKILEIYKGSKCPCIKCLVKPICENSCEDFMCLLDIYKDE